MRSCWSRTTGSRWWSPALRPRFTASLCPSSAWSVSGSRRTSSVGRGCEALPLWPRWERRGDSLTQKCVHHRGVSLSLSSGSRVWPSVVVSLTKQVVVGSFLLPLFTWLILPVVICLSQRLSHASVSTSTHVKRNCEWLIKSVVVHLIVPVTRITVAILELIHAKSADCFGGMRAFIRPKTDLLRQ